MNARILPPEEYHRLERTETPLIPSLPPEDSTVVVVEDDGKVVACMSVLRVTHFEGAWIDPEHRNAGVTRGLIDLSMAVARARGSVWVFAGAGDDKMRDVLDRLGAKRIPMDTYVLGLGGDTCLPR